uniref:Uncharacterized protein n=1 Tax=Moniliophthora roreri TaxID=221103 RepID=A0A0W0FB02_MONRR
MFLPGVEGAVLLLGVAVKLLSQLLI